MASITPNQASVLSSLAYEIRYNHSYLDMPIELENDFTFSDVAKGTSGGFFFRSETGFALLGKGKGQRHKGDLIIACRGTAGLEDKITDITAHGKGTDTGEVVHAGFQSTFFSMRKGITKFLHDNPTSANGTIHCVGHSLGGALATLTANWISANPSFKGKVKLYTFGSPRVGLRSFSINASPRITEHFRCVNGADPVPKAPVWPFYHVPYDGSEYLLSRAKGLSKSAHDIDNYIFLTRSKNWNSLGFQKANTIFKRVVLNYSNRIHVTNSADWADKISAAILTLLADNAMVLGTFGLQSMGATISTVYDAVARSMVKISELTEENAERVKGLLGHMLMFAGKGANIAIKFTFSFIRWVFNLVINKLNQAVNAALKSTF